MICKYLKYSQFVLFFTNETHVEEAGELNEAVKLLFCTRSRNTLNTVRPGPRSRRKSPIKTKAVMRINSAPSKINSICTQDNHFFLVTFF